MPEDNSNAMASLIDYLYRGITPCTSKDTVAARRLYVMAEKLCMPELMDKLIDRISFAHEQRKCRLQGAHVENIYLFTHESSRLRQYCVADVFCYMLRVASREASRSANDEWVRTFHSMSFRKPAQNSSQTCSNFKLLMTQRFKLRSRQGRSCGPIQSANPVNSTLMGQRSLAISRPNRLQIRSSTCSAFVMV